MTHFDVNFHPYDEPPVAPRIVALGLTPIVLIEPVETGNLDADGDPEFAFSVDVSGLELAELSILLDLFADALRSRLAADAAPEVTP